MKRILYILMLVLLFICSNGYKVHATTEATLMDSLDSYGFNEAQEELIRTETNTYMAAVSKETAGNMDAFKAKMKDLFNKLRDGFRVYRLAREPKVAERIADFDSLRTGLQIHVLVYVQSGFMNNIFQRLAEMYYTIQNPDKYIKLKYELKQAPTYTTDQPLFAPVASVVFSASVTTLFAGKITEQQVMLAGASAFSTSSYNILQENIKDDISLSVDAELDAFSQKLDKEAKTSTQAELLSKYTDVSVEYIYGRTKRITLKEIDNILFMLPSCQYAAFSVSGINDVDFQDGKHLSTFTYKGALYRFSFVPSTSTDKNGDLLNMGQYPNNKCRFLPFSVMDNAVKESGQLPGIYNKINGFAYIVLSGKNTYYNIDARWFFNGIQLTDCANGKLLAEEGNLIHIDDCAAFKKQCEDESSKGAANGSGWSSSSTTIVDYTKDANGVSLVNQDEIRTIGLSASEWNDKFGVKVKIYLLSKQDPDYKAHFAEANNDATPGRIIIVIDGTKENHSIKLDHKFKIPDWISKALPSNNSYSNDNTCISDYINPALDALHKTKLYTSAPLAEQILQEYSVVLYRGLFGSLYCLTDEASMANKGATMKFVAGGLHEMIHCIDLADLIAVLAEMGKGAASATIETYVDFIVDQKTTFEDIVSGKPIPPAELARRLIPPNMRLQMSLCNTLAVTARNMALFYFTECDSVSLNEGFVNMCPYRYGQLTVMIVPIVFTAGEWAIVKSAPLISKLKAFRGIKKADVVAKTVSEAVGSGAEVTRTPGKIVIQEGDEITTIERVGDDVVVTQANRWMDDIFNSQKSVVNENKNSIASSSNNAKGAFGEIASDALLTEKGFEPLHSRKTALTQGWGETGIDGIFKKNGEYYIVEAKYTGNSKLKMTDDGLQMSDGWIIGSGRLNKTVGNTLANEIRVMGYKRILAKVSPDGNIVYKQLDELANEIGDFTP